jgi:ACR3 family arsenite efflux pump ArsB
MCSDGSRSYLDGLVIPIAVRCISMVVVYYVFDALQARNSSVVEVGRKPCVVSITLFYIDVLGWSRRGG